MKYLKRSPSGNGVINQSSRNNPKQPVLPSKIDAYVKNLESERDFYKREIETLTELLRTASSSSSKRSTTPTNRVSRRESLRSKSPAKSPVNGIQRQKSSSPVKSTPTPATNRCSVCSGRSTSPGGAAAQQMAIEEIKKLKREKDELKALLDKFEGYMEQVKKSCLTFFRSQMSSFILV